MNEPVCTAPGPSSVPRSLRILIVHERFPPDYGGGGEYVVLQTALTLQAAGHDVRVITTGDPAADLFEGIRIRRLPMSRYRFNLAWRAVRDAARDVDVIHGFSNHAALPAATAGRRLGKPVVFTLLALFGPVWRDVRGPLVGRIFEAFERMMLRLEVTRRVFLSPESRDEAVRLGLQRADDLVIAPGISLEDYGPGPVKAGVAFSGKLDPRKGTAIVLQMARELPALSFRAVVWGDAFDAFSRAAPPNLVVERFVDRPQLARVLGAARIFLFPSRAETFGLVVAEAMASGCAIVGSAPIPFEGERIDPSDPADVRRALEALSSDEARCHRCGMGNVKLARAFSWTEHRTRLLDVYEEVLAPAQEDHRKASA